MPFKCLWKPRWSCSAMSFSISAPCNRNNDVPFRRVAYAVLLTSSTQGFRARGGGGANECILPRGPCYLKKRPIFRRACNIHACGDGVVQVVPLLSHCIENGHGENVRYVRRSGVGLGRLVERGYDSPRNHSLATLPVGNANQWVKLSVP